MSWPTRVVAALAAVLALAASTSPAGAVVADDPTPEIGSTAPRLLLTSLQAVVGPAAPEPAPDGDQGMHLPSSFSSRVLVDNRSATSLEGVDVVVEVYPPATSRSGLRASLDGPGPLAVSGPGRVVMDRPLEVVPAGGFAQLDIEVPADVGQFVGDDDVTVRPVEVSLVRGTVVLTQVRTAVVGVSRPVARPLETALVLPLDGPAPATPEQVAAAAPLLLPGGRLDRLLRAAEGAPSGHLTVVPAAHTVEDLLDLVDATTPGAPDVLARLRSVVTDRASGVLSAAYALADVPALASTEETADLADAAIVAGRQRLLELAGTAPDAAHLLLSSQTPNALELSPSDVLVTYWDEGAGPDLEEQPSANVPPALRTSRTEAGRTLTVLVGDPWVTGQLADATGTHGWAVDAHRVVLESAITFAQRPGIDGRAFAVLPPLGWDPPGRLADEVYARLAAVPWLRTADPLAVASRTTVIDTWEPAVEVQPERTSLLSRVGELEERLGGLASAVRDVESQPDVVDRSADLLRAVSVWPDDDPLERAGRILDDLDEGIAEAIGQVTVPRNSVVTLASESGTIPVTVQHPEGVPMDVLVEVATQGRLAFSDGTSRPVRLEPGGTSTVSFEARALGRGSFPMEVTVRTPTGDVVLDRSLVVVRASAVSRPALLVIAAVVLVLLVLGRRRRPARPKLEVVR